VLKAARLLREHTGYRQGAKIDLKLGIPVGTGLGGGSSDAATTLHVLNDMWGLGLSDERLVELAAELGSDVPFFVNGGCALGEGRGELVTALPPITDCWAVVLVPLMRVAEKTGFMYSRLTDVDFSDGSVTRRLAQGLTEGRVAVDDVAAGKNAFERVAEAAFPDLNTYRQAFADAGAPFVRLCGSGPAFFSLFAKREMGVSVRDELLRGGYKACLASLVGAQNR
jgi:4-diphosphocytidyl-2-C-methyl-D-erythritol kinase